MLVGVNYPWSFNLFGSDLGRNANIEPHNGPRAIPRSVRQGRQRFTSPLFASLERNLRESENLGVEVVLLASN